MGNDTERVLIFPIDVGGPTDGEPEGRILFYRFPSQPDLELVMTARHNGDAAITVSPDEAKWIGQSIFDAVTSD